MNIPSELIALIVVTVILYSRPLVLVNFSQTMLGKAVLLFLAVAASLHSTVSGILIALAIVILAENQYEGMEAGNISVKAVAKDDDKADDEAKAKDKADEAYDEFDRIRKLRKEHCRAKNDKQTFVDSEGKEMTLEEIKKKYPYINFEKGDCNPCDETCHFSISDAEERIVTDEKLRAKPADDTPK